MNRIEIENRLKLAVTTPDVSTADAIQILDRAGTGILLLCNSERQLVATLTDGDIRRAILRGVRFSDECLTIANRHPLIALAPVTPTEALYLMDHGRDFVINHLPVVNAAGQVVELLLRSDLSFPDQLALSAVIMAGGTGTRLRPLTDDLPKPMLPVGDRPLMELMIGQLRDAGIRRVNVTTHYLADKIIDHFGDGRAFGIELNYVTEDQPLGTAGALGLMKMPNEPVLVINGDILTRTDFRAMLEFHREHKADLTVAVAHSELQVPYGVLECEGPRVRRLREKPRYDFLINAGIYLLEPSVYRSIPIGGPLDMTDLIQLLLQAGQSVISFPIIEYWLDIGQQADYERAQNDVKQGRLRVPLLPS
jgi:dTDP-glucose pyrophosphorylase/CBS domain-containing protein